jgi:hypothetical protein
MAEAKLITHQTARIARSQRALPAECGQTAGDESQQEQEPFGPGG